MHERWEHRRSYFLQLFQCCEARVDSRTMVVRCSECPFSNVPQAHARKSQAFVYCRKKRRIRIRLGKRTAEKRENGASGILTRVGEMRTSTISDCHDERQLFRPALSSPRQVRACMRRGRSDRGAVACSGEPAGMQNKPWKGQADTTLRLLG